MRRGAIAAIAVVAALATACATWPGTTAPGLAVADVALPALADVAALPIDDTRLCEPPSLRRLDGVWWVEGPGGAFVVFRRAVPGDAEPRAVGVAVDAFADAVPSGATAFAYSVAALAAGPNGWTRGPASAELYVTPP